MTGVLALTGLGGLLCAALYGQPAAFEAADVRVSHVNSTNFNVFMGGPSVHSGRYAIRTATMADLVSTAYGVDADKVIGGPTWLEMDRYDVVGKLPAGSTPESQKLMLQSLLADRFKLAAHRENQLMPAYALTASRHPQVKESAGGEDKGCKVDFKGFGNGPQAAPSEGAPQVPTVVYTCHNMTMAAFVEDMRGGIASQFTHGRPILDRTELQGSWDFSFKFTLPGMPGASSAADNITMFDALDKQLGLKLEPVKTALPVIVVDSVNQKPTDNAPDIEKILPGIAAPTEFEVADVIPTPSDFRGSRFDIQPGGRVNLQGVTLQMLVGQAWGLSDEMILGAPKWFDQDRFDIVAKAPSAALSELSGPRGPSIDFNAVMTMVKSLLEERFKLTTHMEERTISAYTLVAGKPKMKAGDSNGRIKCMEGPGADDKDPRDANPILGRLITCQNMSMARFADMLMGLAPGYIHAPVLDATGLEGTWEFTLSFSMAGQLQSGVGRRGGDPGAPASDPNGALSLLDALPKQLGVKLEQSKRPVKVLVIDHVEQKPVDN